MRLSCGGATCSELLDPKKEPLEDVVLDFMDCRVLDASGIEVRERVARFAQCSGCALAHVAVHVSPCATRDMTRARAPYSPPTKAKEGTGWPVRE